MGDAGKNGFDDAGCRVGFEGEIIADEGIDDGGDWRESTADLCPFLGCKKPPPCRELKRKG